MSPPAPPSTPFHKGLETLPAITRYITTHDPTTGKAILHAASTTAPAPAPAPAGEGEDGARARAGAGAAAATATQWTTYDEERMAFSTVYTTTGFPAEVNGEADVRAHEKLVAEGSLSLVNPRGTVCRMVDISPGYESIMHRTQSIDYGVVIEGELILLLDGGAEKLLKRGDCVVQRATMHAWRNASQTAWARCFFVLQECAELVVGGEKMVEDLGAGLQP